MDSPCAWTHETTSKRLEGTGSANGAKVRKPFRSLIANRDAERSSSPKAAAGQHAVALTQLMGKPFTRVKTREITKIAIDIWSPKTTGALPRRRNRVRARRADGRVAGASRRDGRPWLNCRRATYTMERGSKEH
ncbi:hypothetical protein EVAR_48638_1 [Eumeta japonica]|uniref:Uncharacterized protein n=1 Tax=Eumeta variegata TaxID=151549 RepID=A0A4C1XMX5_EUMVA|nr:hypothetical protein EVAR_48638_1 [Eumeta japonica]